MTAKEFVNSKLGDKNYTHSDYPISRTQLEEWLTEYHVSKVKHLGLFSVIARYLFRALGLPFFMILALIGAFRGYARYVTYYVLWGGEAAHYTRDRNRKTIADVFDKVRDNVL
jgi:hypothetical protein